MKTPENSIDLFEEFKQKEKFVQDTSLFYPGIGDNSMRPILTKKINKAADDFMEIATSENPTEKNIKIK